MTKTLSVTAIEKGTVIDHIPAGQATRIVSLFGLASDNNQVTIGLNLQGKHGLKDLIKVENRVLSDKEAHELAIFAPNATINVIEGFKVVGKQKVEEPKEVKGLLICPNPICISNQEHIRSHFMFYQEKNKVQLACKYCEKIFERDDIKEYA